MGKSGQPDFGQVADSQGEANREVVNSQLWANRPTIYTPWGYQDWQTEQVRDPATGDPVTQWSMTQGLSPELQDMLNKQLAVQGGRTDLAGGLVERMQNEFGTPMSWDNFNPLHGTPTAQFTMPENDVGNPYETRQRAEDAVYNSAMSRIQPQQESERQALELRMRNQGLRPGDAAWESQVEGLGRRHNDQTNQAMWSAVGEGRAESGQMFGQGVARNDQNFNQALAANSQNYGQSLQSANYANQLRQQQITEQMQQRGYSLNEINALLSGQQVQAPQMPQFQNASLAQPTPVMTGAAQQASIDAATNPWGAIASAGGAALAGAATGWNPGAMQAGSSAGGALARMF